jgi:transcriptional regulator with XRE-family HTH domain
MSSKISEYRYCFSFFAERVKFLMHAKGITQSQLSKACGITQSLISDYLNGKVEPSFKNARKMAGYFNVSLDWLAGLEKETPFRIAEKAAPYNAGTVQELLECYNQMKPEQKKLLLNMAKALAAKG